MSKANKLREALKAANNRMTYADAMNIVGVRSNISHMLKTGELTVIKDDDGRWVERDPNFAIKNTLPIKRNKAAKRAKGSKKKHAKAPRKAVRTMKDLVDKHVPESRTEALARIAMQNLIASTEGLAAIVRDQVEGIDTNPALRSQIEASERAAQLARLV